MPKWYEGFPKLDLGFTPEQIASTRQYVGRSYAAAFIACGIGLGIGTFLHKYADPSKPKEKKKQDDFIDVQDKSN